MVKLKDVIKEIESKVPEVSICGYHDALMTQPPTAEQKSYNVGASDVVHYYHRTEAFPDFGCAHDMLCDALLKIPWDRALKLYWRVSPCVNDYCEFDGQRLYQGRFRASVLFSEVVK